MTLYGETLYDSYGAHHLKFHPAYKSIWLRSGHDIYNWSLVVVLESMRPYDIALSTAMASACSERLRPAAAEEF